MHRNLPQQRQGRVKLVSWNVKGLNNRVKSVKVFSNLMMLKANILYVFCRKLILKTLVIKV